MENGIITLDSVAAYNRLYGLPTHHPSVAVVDLKEARRMVNHVRMNYGIYALFLKNGAGCTLKYGRRRYDCQEGTVVSFAPGQVVDVEMREGEFAPDVLGLVFHPDLIYGTPLGDKIASFGFFDYAQTEALHLSREERAQFLDCLERIRVETLHPVDSHSAALIAANIQILLEYLHRFYDRQFLTRHRVNSQIVARFEHELKSCFESPRETLPNVAYFAQKANLTPGYFGDLVRRETGTSPQKLIALHLISVAKQRLARTGADVGTIAYDLGFEYPAHFSRMFKRMTGQSPTEYRSAAADGR